MRQLYNLANTFHCANLRLSGDSLPCYCVGLKMSETCHAMLVRTVKLPGPVNDLDPDPTAEANPATGSVGLHRVTSTMIINIHNAQTANQYGKHRPSRWKRWTLVSHGVTPSHLWVTLASHPSHSWKVACLGLGNFC